MALRLAVLGIFLAAQLPQIAYAHRGGCRKSSPPGQCCHMDNRAGRVHWHCCDPHPSSSFD